MVGGCRLKPELTPAPTKRNSFGTFCTAKWLFPSRVSVLTSSKESTSSVMPLYR